VITAEQLRAARAILRMEQTTLASRAGVSVETIKRLERLDGSLESAARADTLQFLRHALELAGVKFVTSKNGEAGVLKADDQAVLAEQAKHYFARAFGCAIEELTKQDPNFWARSDAMPTLQKIASLTVRELPNAQDSDHRDRDKPIRDSAARRCEELAQRLRNSNQDKMAEAEETLARWLRDDDLPIGLQLELFEIIHPERRTSTEQLMLLKPMFSSRP
jgi:transcriptional regulator with XRE-family HTH domain